MGKLLHQFNMVVKGGYKVVIHGIQIALSVHPNWVVL
jgi:hypothetical protein